MSRDQTSRPETPWAFGSLKRKKNRWVPHISLLLARCGKERTLELKPEGPYVDIGHFPHLANSSEIWGTHLFTYLKQWTRGPFTPSVGLSGGSTQVLGKFFSRAWRVVYFMSVLWTLSCSALFASDSMHKVMLRDITQIEGVRENQLVGYGLVIGLNRTGDTQQTFFTVQTLANSLTRMGVQIAPGVVVVKNVAAVFVTANLPAFARPGMRLDVTVSSVGDAKSIVGGVLLLTALRAANGQVYAEAQGPLVIGGYSEGNAGNTRSVNHPTVGRIAEGGIIEREAAVDLSRFHTVSLLLFNSDFTAARDVAAVINTEFGKPIANAIDSNRIDVDVAQSGETSVPILISRVQNLSINFRSPAKVVVNERTGTIVMGGDVRLSPVSVIHGSLTIDVQTINVVSQPAPLSNGETKTVTETKLSVNDAPAQAIQLQEGANVDELIKGLHAIGATSHDIIAILQAIKAAGGLQADLEVI